MTGEGHGKIGKTVQDSRPYWPEAPKRPKGAPNILVILFDDVGLVAAAWIRKEPKREPEIRERLVNLVHAIAYLD